MLPVLSGLAWLGMLMGMLAGWAVGSHRQHYANMKDDQSIAYISDVGASPRFKPVFVTFCCVTTALLDLSFLADRWLRHRGRLTPNGSTFQKVLAVLTILFAFAGTAGLVLLSVFDVAHHKHLHDCFLVLFLGGYVFSAVCACWEFQRLGRHNRTVPVLRVSFWIKLAFILLEAALAVAFAALAGSHYHNGGAILEWTIAFVFSFYVFSFAVDLYPAVHTRHDRPTKSVPETIASVDTELANSDASRSAADAAAAADSEPVEMHGGYDQSAARTGQWT